MGITRPTNSESVLSIDGMHHMWTTSKTHFAILEFRVRPWEDESPASRIDQLVDAMADLFHVKRDEFRRKKRRYAHVCYAQQLTWWILRKRWHMPYELIAAYFECDRSTIYHGVRNVDDLMESEPDFAMFVDMIPYFANITIDTDGNKALQASLYPEGMLPIPAEIKTPQKGRKGAKKGSVK